MRRLLPCLILVAALVAGCGLFESNEIDWQSRVGTYSYEDAVKDYGEPQSCQEYADGGQSCNWKTDAIVSSDRNMVLTFDSYGYFESMSMMSK
ncbi:MAG: hypothetical protein ACOCWR_04615 [Oceanidesulfovibrio sp.]